MTRLQSEISAGVEMRCAIVGAGALGSIFAARLAKAGQDIVLLGRSSAHVEAIRNDGLLIVDPSGITERVRFDARPDATGAAPVDVALFLTKSQDTGAAAEHARPIITPDTTLITLQNGIGNLEALEHVLGAHPMVAGVTAVGARVIEPGRIEITSGVAERKAKSWMGAWRGTCKFEHVEKIAAALETAGLPAEAEHDVQPLIWTKLAMASAMNAVAAVSRLGVQAVLDSDAGRKLIEGVISEVVAVANARGIALDLATVTKTAFDIYSASASHIPSMAADLIAGRPTEISALNEAVGREAQGLGVDAPLNMLLARLIRLSESGMTKK